MRPVPRPAVLNGYVGKWVALLDGVVIASASTPVALAERIFWLDEPMAVVQFVSPPSNAYRVGAG